MKTIILTWSLLFMTAMGFFSNAEASISEVTWIEKGMQAVQENRLADALADFREAKKVNPQSAPALVGEAQVLTLQDAWDEALALLNRAIQIAPEFAIAYHNRGILKFYKGQALAAHADLRKAIELGESVETDLLYQVWGAAFPGDAVKMLTEQIQKDPQNGQAYLNRGIAYFYQENYQATLDDWAEAKKLGAEPDSAMWDELERNMRMGKEIENIAG